MSSARSTSGKDNIPVPRKRILDEIEAPRNKKICFASEKVFKVMDKKRYPNFSTMEQKAAGGSNSCGERKILLIRNFKNHAPETLDHVSESWSCLKEAVIAIQESRKLRESLTMEYLYRCVDNLITQQLPSQLYSDIRGLTEIFIRRQLDKFLDSSGDRFDFLRQLNNCWIHHCQQMKMVGNIFLALDRGYVLQTPNVCSIWDMGLELFRVNILAEVIVENRSIDGLLMMIQQERAGETIDRSLVKSLLRMLSSLDIYHTVFEERFLTATEQLYSREGQRLMEETDVPQYLVHVDKRLSEENNRILHYLDQTTRRQLIYCVEKQLLSERKTEILKKGLAQLLDSDKKKELSLLYSLYARIIDGLSDLCKHFNSYIIVYCTTIVMNPQKDKVMVQELLDFKDKLDLIVKKCFADSNQFVSALKKAFEASINQRPNKPAELIAKFVDGKLRSGNKEATEDELERLLDKIMVLFRFINGKDVFEAYYNKDLSKRLLLAKSASVDAEKSMLSKLKQECGSAFTNKLEGMFKDMEVSKDLMIGFKQHLQASNRSVPVELSVNILTMGNWPTYNSVTAALTPDMVNFQEIFTQFYVGKHQGRKLQWQPNLGHCVLKATFVGSSKTEMKELQVSLFQAITLLLFNKSDSLTFAEITDRTNIEDSSMRRTLQSLACGKARVLTKSPKGRDVNDGDEFIYNRDFPKTNPLFRIKINQIQMKETNEEHEKTEEKVFQDRQCMIDAAIVRIMKMRKAISHVNLITELFDLLKFPVKPADLKKRIENLIDKEFIERDKTDPTKYHYIA